MALTVCAIFTDSRTPRPEGRWLLERALQRARLWERLADACQRHTRPPGGLQILILPELLALESGATETAAGTSPRLVEHLIDLLGERGYGAVAVGVTLGPEGAWLHNRDLDAAVEAAGYRRSTDGGREYPIADLSDDVIWPSLPAQSVLSGVGLARRLVEADFRIVFAKNRTDREHGYALCVHTLLNALPLRDRHYHYRARLKPWDLGVDLLRYFPPQFAVIDGLFSSHGSWASQAPATLPTATVIASPDALLADWAGALKMGLDPHVSAVNDRALAAIGLPEAYDIVGELTPYEGWRNVHPVLREATRRINESVGVSSVLAPLITRVERGLFPFKSPVLDRANRTLSAYLAPQDGDPLTEWPAIWLHQGLAAAVEGVEAWRTMFAKQQLRWREAPLDLDLDALSEADFAAVDAEVEPIEQLIRAVPADPGGLSWRHLDGSVVFQYRHVFPIPYAQFVARVDISRAIQYMNDYIGGRAVPLARDDRGRIIRQAERNLYLPQPNYLALYGGTMIDVTKLEVVHHAADSQRIRWRTLHSANGSAEYDDGSVCFSDGGASCTEVTVVGRQKFTLPLFWQVFDLDRTPEIRDVLIGDAYFTFFEGTMANLEAAWEGREYRVGRPWDPHPADGERPHAPSFDVNAAVHRASDLWARLRAAAGAPSQGPQGDGRLDEHGFRHFQAPRPDPARGPTGPLGPLERFVSDLSAAVVKDLGFDRDPE